MSPNPLTETVFKATTEGKMTNVTERPGGCIDIWQYVRMVQQTVALPQQVIDGQFVEYVYRSGSGHHDHVLVPAGRFNVFWTRRLVRNVRRRQTMLDSTTKKRFEDALASGKLKELAEQMTAEGLSQAAIYHLFESFWSFSATRIAMRMRTCSAVVWSPSLAG